MSDVDEFASVGESAEEFTEKSRLRSLFTARDEAAQAIRDAAMREYELLNNGNPKASELVDEHVRSAVVAYTLECEPLFRNTQTGQQYWTAYEFAPVPVPNVPPEEITNDGVGPNYRGKEILGVPESAVSEHKRQILVRGIGQYVDLPSPIKVRWTGYTDGPLSSGRSDATAITTTGVPRQLSESTFRATNQLLSELDIGIDAETQSGEEAHVDYSDLL